MEQQNGSPADVNGYKKSEKPWLKIFIIIIAVLLVLNGLKTSISSFGKKGSNNSSSVGTDDDKKSSNNSASVKTGDDKKSSNNASSVVAGDDKKGAKSEEIKAHNTIDVPELESAEIAIDTLLLKSIDIPAAEFITFSGSITTEKQVDTYDFSIPRKGRYRFDFSNIVASSKVRFQIYDSLEKCIVDQYCSNGEGVTELDLVANDNYKLCVKQYKGLCDYTLTIGIQKETVDISEYTSVNDCTEYTEQSNVYSYTVPNDGRLRMEIADLMGTSKVRLMMWDSLDQNVVDTYCSNGEGTTITDLKAGDVYQIQVRQNNGFSPYKLNVYGAKPDVDISQYSMVKDSVEFIDQRNVYWFTVPEDGRYRFDFSNLRAGLKLRLRIFDSNMQSIEDASCSNNEGATIKGLKTGDTYQVQVVQNSDIGDYVLNIGKQKPEVKVDGSTQVNDSIQFNEQRNIYVLEGKEGASYKITVFDMAANQKVELIAFDELEYELASNMDAKANDSILIEDLKGNQEIDIQVRQKNGLGKYSITVVEQ